MEVPLLINDFLRRAAKLYPDKTAIIDGERRFTYREFQERVNQLAHALLGSESAGRPRLHPQPELALLPRELLRRHADRRHPRAAQLPPGRRRPRVHHQSRRREASSSWTTSTRAWSMASARA